MAESRLQQWKSLVYVLEKSSTVHVHVHVYVDLFHHLGGPPMRPMSFRLDLGSSEPEFKSRRGSRAEQSPKERAKDLEHDLS
jgi:hypothetical protein